MCVRVAAKFSAANSSFYDFPIKNISQLSNLHRFISFNINNTDIDILLIENTWIMEFLIVVQHWNRIKKKLFQLSWKLLYCSTALILNFFFCFAMNFKKNLANKGDVHLLCRRFRGRGFSNAWQNLTYREKTLTNGGRGQKSLKKCLI